jgi:hypothetical protein
LVTHAPVEVLHTWPALHCESEVHLPHWLGPPPPHTDPAALPAQSAFVQQLPGTQALPTPPLDAQQKSAGLTHAVLGVVQLAATHVPLVVLQMVDGPYVGSAWHWLSAVHAPQVLALVAPQSWPAVQSVSEWQLPGTQLPALQMYAVEPPPYAVVQLASSAGSLHGAQTPALPQRPAVEPMAHALPVGEHAPASDPESPPDELPEELPESAPDDDPEELPEELPDELPV